MKFDRPAREKIKAGIDQVANAVKVTIGPRGRNVIIEKGFGSPMITNDGASIAKEIELEDKFENIGAELIKEVANKTNDVAGDGTTTAVVLAQAIIGEGLKFVAAGMNPVNLRKGIEEAKDEIVKELQQKAKSINSREEIAQVATISAENKEIGNLIAEVINEVGKDGVITVEESQTFGFSKELVKGMSFDKGYISPYMITDSESLKAEMKDPWIILTDKKISAINEILPLLEKITSSGKKDIVIIAEEVEGEALATLVVNKLRGIINVLAIKAPEFGDTKKEMLEDIAILTGGKVITEEKGMKFENAGLEMLGRAAKVIATKDSTTIISGKGKKKEIEVRVSQLKNQSESSDSKWDKEKLKKRLAKLSGGVAIIKVGAATEAELTYLKHKTDDALAATRAAVEEGIVTGGGTALLKASASVYKKYLLKVSRRKNQENSEMDKIKLEYDSGYALLTKALEGPIRQIVLNAGKDDPGVVINKVKESRLTNFGYDANQESFVEDMIKIGIVDPLKVTRTALENAVSMAAILLTSEVAIAEKVEKSPNLPNPSLSGMGSQMM